MGKKISKKGIKFDKDKIRIDLIPPELIEELGKVLTHGAKKYKPRNWEEGMSWTRIFAALQRHLWAWLSKETMDKDSKLSHLSHAVCNLAFLIAYEKRNIGEDDRPIIKT